MPITYHYFKPIPSNTRARHLASILSRVQNKENPPIRTTETLLKDVIEKAREEPRQKEILEEIRKTSFNTAQHQQHKEENITIVKSSISNTLSFQDEILKLSDPTSVKTNVNLFYLHLLNSTFLYLPHSTINKDEKIVIRLNKQKAILNNIFMDVIFKNLNIYTDRMGGYYVLM